MLEPTTDLTPAAWLVVERDGFGGTVGELVPDGFAAYLRIFHRPDQGRPGGGAAASWAEVAARHGTVLHPEAQWTALTGGDDLSAHRPDDPASPSDQALTGTLDRWTLRRLAVHLAEHTATPETCHVALWNGTGRAPARWHGSPLFRRPGRGYWLLPPVPVAEVPSLAVELEVLGMEEEVRTTGRLSGLMSTAPRTPQGDLDHVRREREQGSVQSPSYWWPEDRTWIVHSEVDYDSTMLAGSDRLAAALLDDPEVECLPVSRRTSLFADADRVNVRGGRA